MKDTTKGKLRGVPPKPGHRDNRFRRLIGLCGLSTKEAAEYLDLSIGTIEQKLLGKRGTTTDDERELAALWRKIRTGKLDSTYPPGAVRQYIALQEMIAISAGMDPDETVAEIEADLAEDDGGYPASQGVPTGKRFQLKPFPPEKKE